MKQYAQLYREMCDKNRSIVTIVGRDLKPMCIFECQSPDLFGEPVIIIQGLNF